MISLVCNFSYKTVTIQSFFRQKSNDFCSKKQQYVTFLLEKVTACNFSYTKVTICNFCAGKGKDF